VKFPKTVWKTRSVFMQAFAFAPGGALPWESFRSNYLIYNMVIYLLHTDDKGASPRRRLSERRRAEKGRPRESGGGTGREPCSVFEAVEMIVTPGNHQKRIMCCCEDVVASLMYIFIFRKHSPFGAIYKWSFRRLRYLSVTEVTRLYPGSMRAHPIADDPLRPNSTDTSQSDTAITFHCRLMTHVHNRIANFMAKGAERRAWRVTPVMRAYDTNMATEHGSTVAPGGGA
jgi:hypothetical protein